MELTREFAKRIVSLRYEEIPEEIIKTAKERLLDTIGAMLAGRAGWGYARKLQEAVSHLGEGDRKPIGPDCPYGYPAARAAMLNASFAHAVELDDGHKFAGVHAGAVVVPSALEMGAVTGAGGKAVLTAIVLGYEVAYRLAVTQSPDLIDHGFHPSSVCDTAGAAAVAGKLLGLDEEQMAAALGFAGLEAAGLMEATISGQQSKCVMVGNAAFRGISCAYVAAAGLEGTTTVFEGKKGMFAAMSRKLTAEEAVEGMGDPWWISETYSKFYPTCRHSQPAIEAALNLAAAHGIIPDQVESVEVGTHQVAYDLTGIIRRPQNPGEAKFSIPYGIAAALRDRNVGVRHLKEAAFTDPAYLELADRVQVRVEEEVNRQYPKRRGARVTILLKDGTRYEEECYDLKGSPQNPVGFDQLLDKFDAAAAGLLNSAVTEEIKRRCAQFEAETEIDSFLGLLHWQQE